jgi:hypothetical protein
VSVRHQPNYNALAAERRADLHNYVQEYIWDSIIHSITWSNDYAIIMQIIAWQFDSAQAKQMAHRVSSPYLLLLTRLKFLSG